jgi:hypothetical protein
MNRMIISCLTLLFFGPLMLAQEAAPVSSAPSGPLNMTQVWNLDATYADHQHGVTFRYPSLWKATSQFAYHPPTLTMSEQEKSVTGFGYSEGGFPRKSIVGPYSQTNLEGFGVVYSAVPARDAVDCKRLAATLARTPRQLTTVLGGRSFVVYDTGEAGMSQFIYGKLYITYAGRTCYRFETDVAAADADAAGVKALTPEQYRSIDEHLLEIMKSVRISSVNNTISKPGAISKSNSPWNSKLCKGKGAESCGIVVRFHPPIKDALLVPNEVTVDVPLELGQVSKVVVSSYPRGTGVGDIPEQEFVQMRHSQKIGGHARFRGVLKKCTDQGSLHVLVYFKGFEHNPITPYGMAVECRESEELK